MALGVRKLPGTTTYKPKVTKLKVPALRPVAKPPVAAKPAGAPAPVQFAPLPVDPGYDAQVAAAARNRDATLAGLAGQRVRTVSEYGYTPQVGAGGAITGLTFDPSNSFSRAAVLKRQYDEQRTGNVTSYAARGQLYAGSLQNAQNASNRGELQASDSLQKSLLAFLANVAQRENAVRAGYEDAVAQAAGDRVARAGESPLYDPIIAQAVAASATPAAAKPGAAPPVPAKGVRPPARVVNAGVIARATIPRKKPRKRGRR